MPPALAFHAPTEQRFQRVARLAARVFGLSGASVLLASGRHDWFRGPYRVQLDTTPRVDPLAERVIEKGAPVVLTGDTPSERENADERAHATERVHAFYIGYPLHAPDGTPVGVLSVADVTARPLRHEDLAIMRDLATILEDEFRRMALTTSRRGLLEELSDARRRALMDPLTHVWNRAGLDELLQREVPRSFSLARPISLAMVDLDSFKLVNDTHGHVIGDLVLEAVAERLRVAARPGDAVARYGGEEFAILLPGCGDLDAPLVGERFRKRIASEPFRPRAGVALDLTVSIGVATLGRNETPASLVNRADAALYAAKHAGRNRVHAADFGVSA